MSEQDTSDLIDQASDWGTTVSEAKAKRGALARFLIISACIFLALASILIIPIAAGTMLFTSSSGAIIEIVFVGALLAIALNLKKKSSNLPRNALQIDYSACELRLGAEHSDGTFIREQVIGFREIEEVYINDDNPEDPALCFRIPGEVVDLRFHKAEQDSLNALVNQIAAARESALRAPVRSRIQSRIMGFEASFREAKQRIRTRIVTRTAT